jgi:hypothetical protein
MARGNPQIRYNTEMKKAVLMGDEYDYFKTFRQFYAAELQILTSRRSMAQHAVEKFATSGGSLDLDTDTGVCTVQYGGTSYVVEYDEDGGVRRYTVENPAGDEEDILYLHWMFYCSVMLERLDTAIAEVEEKIANLENDVLLRSVSKAGGTIGGDTYLLAGAVSGLDLRGDEDVDPFGVFRDED